MAYTRAWDETQPPDTQLANLLGQDIRQLEQNISERVSSFGAGLFANRPTPEAVWGQANFGVMYFATDTRQLFRWTGAAWTDITSQLMRGVLNQQGLNPGSIGTGAAVVLYTYDIPANTAKAGDITKARVYYQHTGANACTLKFNAGASSLSAFSQIFTVPIFAELEIFWLAGATCLLTTTVVCGNGSQVSVGAGALDPAVLNTLNVTQRVAAPDSVDGKGWYVQHIVS